MGKWYIFQQLDFKWYKWRILSFLEYKFYWWTIKHLKIYCFSIWHEKWYDFYKVKIMEKVCWKYMNDSSEWIRFNSFIIRKYACALKNKSVYFQHIYRFQTIMFSESRSQWSNDCICHTSIQRCTTTHILMILHETVMVLTRFSFNVQ